MGTQADVGGWRSNQGDCFNPKGVPALYLGLSIMTAVKEPSLGFAHRIDSCVLCSYEIDWGQDLPHKVRVFDPSGRLPKDQLSWR